MATTEQGEALVAAITQDHRAVEAAFAELESGQGGPEHRRALADHIITELVRHSVGEEHELYPSVQSILGGTLADREIAEHAEAERTMKQLEDVEATDPRFDELLGQLMAEIRKHVAEEEGELLPQLVAAATPEQLTQITAAFLQSRAGAPTRPHPAAPDKPPANLILDYGVGLVDRLRDKLSRRRD